MPLHERFLVLVPVLVTVFVVLALDHEASVHGGLAAFFGQAASDAWHVIVRVAAIGARG